MSYDEDLANAGKWWLNIKGKALTDDVPDTITPHPLAHAVTEMDKLLRRSWCYETERVLLNTDKARAEFFKITSSENMTDFLQYWARFALRAQANFKEAQRVYQGSLISPIKVQSLIRAGKCAVNVLEIMDFVKRYMAAYFSN